MITHYDLFAGIGGFSIAVDEVFDEPIRHIFCEWEKFPTEVLKKHWPDGEYWGDIADLVKATQTLRTQATSSTPNTKSHRLPASRHSRGEDEERAKPADQNEYDVGITILTGGFPCQPFSQAGQRRGTADNRYKWPEMFEVIRNVSPDWVIAENVAGLVSWSDGLVLEQVCADLEGEGYEVWPLVIPAVAVNAPHRRDRVWIIANSKDNGCKSKSGDTRIQSAENETSGGRRNAIRHGNTDSGQRGWDANWTEVATELCSVDDGLPARMGDTTISKSRHRAEQLKAYGNAIVPQVAIQIFRAIRESLNE